MTNGTLRTSGDINGGGGITAGTYVLSAANYGYGFSSSGGPTIYGGAGAPLTHNLRVQVNSTAGNFASVQASNFVGTGYSAMTNGYFIPSNSIANWPTAPRYHGEAWMGNSNGFVYLLTSGVGNTWTATNQIAP